MSYCFNPDCSDPGYQKTLNPGQAKFCTNCGAKLVLSIPLGTAQAARYRAVSLLKQNSLSRTFSAIDEHQSPPLPYRIQQFQLSSDDAESFSRAIALFCQELSKSIASGILPTIPAVIAYFEEEQLQYVVQEEVVGQDLNQVLAKSGSFDESQIRQLLISILTALQLFHSHHLVHGNVRLENIIQRRDRQFVLTGFGIPAFATQPDLTQNGSSTPSTAHNPNNNLTYANDLYSLGIVCVQMLTQMPLAELFDLHQNTWKWLSHVQHPISTTLQQIIEKLLHQAQIERYQSPQDVLADLERLAPPNAAGSGVSSFPKPIGSPQKHWQCVRTLMGHTSWVRSVVVSPNGQVLASGSGDRTIKIWSMQTGELLKTLTGHHTWIRTLAISPDNQMLVSGCNDNTVYLWELATGKQCYTLTGHNDWVRAIAVSPNGRLLASGSQDKRVRIWDLKSLEPVQTLTEHNHWVLTLSFSPDSEHLVTGSRDQLVRLWEPFKGKCYRTFIGHTAEVLAVAVSPDGQAIASSSADQTVKLWKLNTGSLLHTFTSYNSAVSTIAFSPDGKILATGSNDRTIKLWHMGSGKLIETLYGHSGWIWAIAFSPDGRSIISGSWDGTLKIWQCF
jgi:WD40 repeat protein